MVQEFCDHLLHPDEIALVMSLDGPPNAAIGSHDLGEDEAPRASIELLGTARGQPTLLAWEALAHHHSWKTMNRNEPARLFL
mgnify:CR=1 FL=1